MPAAPDATPEHIKDVNTRYHDVAAETYDSKWGIDFGKIGRRQVAAKFGKAVGCRDIGKRAERSENAAQGKKTGPREPMFARALEIGAGTGYFSINLAQLGVVGEVTATDISPGMLDSLGQTAEAMGLAIDTRVCEAEELPFGDGSFDVVFGHAVLHHIPDLDRAMSEFMRVLRPGGRIAFCGEPSRYGDRIAAVPKRAGSLAAPVWRKALRADAQGQNGAHGHDDGAANRHVNGHAHRYSDGHLDAERTGHDLEGEVDVHAFTPGDLRAFASRAGFDPVKVRGEELLSNMYGWGVRTMESTADPDSVPVGWRLFAYRSFIALQQFDARALEPHLPAELFYNLLISAEKPA